MSILFYMYVKVEYVFIIIILILFNYFIGIRLEEAVGKNNKQKYLSLALLLNIGVLVGFKYLNFISENISRIFSLAGIQSSGWVLHIALPLGLSYYTFQSVGYLLDIYRGSLKAEKNILKFGLFTLFFPKLLVGPIERARNLLPQLHQTITFKEENIIEGGKRIAWGLFKKLVVADRISLLQTVIDANPQQQSGITVLFVSILYTFQVYADFSGYSDIAIGSARLFGFKLMENFNLPLFARNLSDFWRRWHISLSSWVNDYIFNPLLLKRRKWGNWGIFYALLISFIVIGIWHGATWNYVLFGVLQAIVLMFETLTKKIRKKVAQKIPAVLYNGASILLTLLFISFTLIIFRSPSFEKAWLILKVIFQNSGQLYFDRPSTLLFILIGVFIMMLYDFRQLGKMGRLNAFLQRNWITQQVAYTFLLIYVLLAAVFDGGQFIYFSF